MTVLETTIHIALIKPVFQVILSILKVSHDTSVLQRLDEFLWAQACSSLSTITSSNLNALKASTKLHLKGAPATDLFSGMPNDYAVGTLITAKGNWANRATEHPFLNHVLSDLGINLDDVKHSLTWASGFWKTTKKVKERGVYFQNPVFLHLRHTS
jgi:hypothetical protein